MHRLPRRGLQTDAPLSSLSDTTDVAAATLAAFLHRVFWAHLLSALWGRSPAFCLRAAHKLMPLLLMLRHQQPVRDPFAPHRMERRVSRSCVPGKRRNTELYSTPLPVLNRINHARKVSHAAALLQLAARDGSAANGSGETGSGPPPDGGAGALPPPPCRPATTLGHSREPLPSLVRPLDLGTVPREAVAKAAKRLVRFPKRREQPAWLQTAYGSGSGPREGAAKAQRRRDAARGKLPYHEAKPWGVSRCKSRPKSQQEVRQRVAAWGAMQVAGGGGGGGGGAGQVEAEVEVPFLRQHRRVPLEAEETAERVAVEVQSLRVLEAWRREHIEASEPLRRSVLWDTSVVCRAIVESASWQPVPFQLL